MKTQNNLSTTTYFAKQAQQEVFSQKALELVILVAFGIPFLAGVCFYFNN
jgi:hypothetical protein